MNNYCQNLKPWRKFIITIITVLITVLIIWIAVIPLVFCGNIDFDLTRNPNYISCSKDVDCISKTCGCLNEKGARKFEWLTNLCSVRLKCVPPKCICENSQCSSVGYDKYTEPDLSKDLSINTDKTEYGTSEDIKLKIVNNSNEEILLYGISVNTVAAIIDNYGEYTGSEISQMNIRGDITCECSKECRHIIKLQPNEEKEFIWDQKDEQCELVGRGLYNFGLTLVDNDKSLFLYSNDFNIVSSNIANINITTDKNEYKQGEEIKVTVKNNSDQRKRFYPIFVEKWQEFYETWDVVDSDIYCQCNEKCEAYIMNLNSNDTKEIVWNQEIDEWDEITNMCKRASPGRYRFAFYVNAFEPTSFSELDLIRYSNEFNIKSENLSANMDSDYCIEDDDCELRFSHCDCAYNCFNKISEDDCRRVCGGINIIPPGECICSDNKCIKTNSEADKKEIESVYNTFIKAEKNCDIDLATSLITEKSKEIIRYTCSNMANEVKCYVKRDYEIRVKDDKAIVYLTPVSYQIENPFFLAKENGEWKFDFYKMSQGIGMGGYTCDTGWVWNNKETQDDFCSFFLGEDIAVCREEDYLK